MYPVLTRVRAAIQNITKELFENLPDIRIGIIAHGDYCDAGNPYTIKCLYLSKDVDSICEFVREVEPTNGGDADECYELALNQARTITNWRAGSEKILMVIGDSKPHSYDYPGNEEGLCWENEVGLLAETGIKIFSVHALANYRTNSLKFYETMAKETGGAYLTLNNFTDVVSLIMATCYSQYGEKQLNKYVSVIRAQGRVSQSLAKNINKLTETDMFDQNYIEDTKSYIAPSGLRPVLEGRFQIFPVDETSSIKEFLVDGCGVEFKAGRTFYELIKRETVQQYKEIILEEKRTGALFYGADARKLLGLFPQCERKDDYEQEIVKPSKDNTYTVFIQSTSHNRKLLEGSRILYEVPDYM